MIGDVDLFQLYRWLLAIVLTVYAVIVTGQWLFGWLRWFETTRESALLGRYASVLLVRIRLRRFAWELLQMGLLLAVLGYVIYWNHRIIS